ncbi:RHS repeat domain-containing protein [Amycolatopsis sp. YIM 10]|uniref:RHS repeat domain-containing protein n=1 Tax=Amycolatopsis sp. YIM 10 TaxID=2653857 RepID=UPI0012900DD3|nr:RHS repeat protein [Amycolatopsis sp. YIM 10]
MGPALRELRHRAEGRLRRARRLLIREAVPTSFGRLGDRRLGVHTGQPETAGRLSGVNAPTGSHTFTYNDRGALLTGTTPAGTTSEYTYDSAGRLAQRSDTTGVAASTYTNDRLTSQTDPASGTTQPIGYDAAGARHRASGGRGAGGTGHLVREGLPRFPSLWPPW